MIAAIIKVEGSDEYGIYTNVGPSKKKICNCIR